MDERTVGEYVQDYPRLATWITEEVGRSLDDLVNLDMAAEMIELKPSPYPWQRFEPGNHIYVTATFRDDYAITQAFKRHDIAYIPRPPQEPSAEEQTEIQAPDE